MKKVILNFIFLFIAIFFIFNGSAQEIKSYDILSKAENITKYQSILGKIIPKPKNDITLPEKPTLKNSKEYKITINNLTGYTVDIYNDSVYIGTIAARKSDYIFTISDTSGLIGESIGGTKIWLFPVHFKNNIRFTWYLLDKK